MMKTNNEMSATPSYTAPVAKLINARLEGLICQSLGEGWFGEGAGTGTIEEDED